MRIRLAIVLAMMVLSVGGLTLPVDASAAVAASATHKGVIVFQTSSGGTIYVVNPDGSHLRYLTTGMDFLVLEDVLLVKDPSIL